jgi:hypothetical protein
MPDVLPGDKFVLGSAVGNITYQASQILGSSRAQPSSPFSTRTRWALTPRRSACRL